MQIVESNGLNGPLHCIVLLSESSGRQMVKSQQLSDSVVEDVDVFGDIALGVPPRREAAVMQQFGL